MAKKITSYEGLFGNTIYRDEHGIIILTTLLSRYIHLEVTAGVLMD